LAAIGIVAITHESFRTPDSAKTQCLISDEFSLSETIMKLYYVDFVWTNPRRFINICRGSLRHIETHKLSHIAAFK
jgi:hypothetical protein